MERDLTIGNERKTMLLFAFPMIIGNILQQLYNIVDTIVVGRFIGADALAAVGTSFSLMVFLTSAIIGLCLGSGSVLSRLYGAHDWEGFKKSLFLSFGVVVGISLVINVLSWVFLDQILSVLQVHDSIRSITKQYLQVVLTGILFTALYNYSSAILRSAGNSSGPVICMFVSTVINIILDVYFVTVLHMGVNGVGWATVIAQVCSAILVTVYVWRKVPAARMQRKHLVLDKELLHKIAKSSALVSIQQSVMNFGILMIQGLVNSFGVPVTAAFAAAVKVDSFAYMPVQDFGNAFAIYIAQNFGAKKASRIRSGTKEGVRIAMLFSLLISAAVVICAEPLMRIFIDANETEIITIGVHYLRIEGTFYCGIGILFLLYGFYRGVAKPEMTLLLTLISLGTRVVLAYALAPIEGIGLYGIWWAIPIGWLLADITGYVYYRRNYRSLELTEEE